MDVQYPMTLDFDDKMRYYRAMIKIVQDVGKALAEYRGEITDKEVKRGHEFSTLDEFAGKQMLASIDHHLGDFDGTVVREMNVKDVHRHEVKRTRKKPYVIIADELEGTTNFKRKKSSENPKGPVDSSVTMAFATNDNLGTLEIGAIYSFFDGGIYSAFCETDSKGRHFQSFRNEHLMDPAHFTDKRGDEARRILVVGYSNRARAKKAGVEDALVGSNFRVYDGCRSSTNDVLGMIADNQFDAYVDPRALWPEGAVLQAYDIAGVIPVSLGCGLVVTDVHGDPINKYGIESTIPIVIARPKIHEEIIRSIEPVLSGYKDRKVIPMQA